MSNTYRKKPVEIQAYPVWKICRASRQDKTEQLDGWLKDAIKDRTITVFQDFIKVNTIEGEHVAGKFHMLIKGVEGELYGCEGAIFDKTYESVDEDE